MIIVSYDIADDKIRNRFAKMLKKNGAIRLQFSVYELSNTKRVTEIVLTKIQTFSKYFSADDSVVLFEVTADKVIKYGNAIHRDKNIVYF